MDAAVLLLMVKLVDFDELMARQRMFKEEEHQVDANADRICNLMGGAK